MYKFPPIAIVSKAFRFPQKLHTDATFWEALQNKECVITEIPKERWPTEELTHISRAEPGRSVTFAAGIIPDVEDFDAGFFGISPREAAQVDPQQRLLLMLTQEALENAGILASSLAGSDCGVYLGISGIDYGMCHLKDLPSITLHSMTGNTMSVAANRISYTFDLHGPSIAIDTACSSSLVALHTACAALHKGEISSALVGGVSVLYHPYPFIGFSKASMISAEGRCLPFDARGAGYVRAEGAAMLILKPLEAALADGDSIEAVICGSGINTDGKRKSGLTIPSIEGQVELMQKVLKDSGLSPDDVDFIEMHGTGTPVGDPIEATAVSTVYAQNRRDVLPISSVKANVGHMEPASAMAGLVKAMLVLKNRHIPAAPFAFEPNPNIDFDALNIRYIANENGYALKEDGTIRVGINSFGFGGANAHVILQSPEDFFAKQEEATVHTENIPPLFFAARSKKALEGLAKNYANILKDSDITTAYDTLYCAATQRDFFEKRIAFWQQDPAQLVGSLEQYAAGMTSSDVSGLCVEQSPLKEDGDIAFIYCGNGSHWLGMAQNLMQDDADFAKCMQDIDALMQEPAGFSLCHMLEHGTAEDLEDTAITQPLIFAIQVGITHFLEKQGIVPKAVAGHSVGEVVAAYVAGAFNLEEAVQIICARSQCQALTAGFGRMAAIKMSPSHTEELFKTLGVEEHVFVAGINTEEHLTLSGSEKHLQRVQEHCQEHGIYFQFLQLNYAFHSLHMDSIEQNLLERLQHIQPKAANKALFVSSVTGTALEGSDLDARYWWNNVRLPVLFAPAMDTLMEIGARIFIEIGPHAILQRYIKDCIKKKDLDCAVFPTLLRKNDHPKRLMETALRVRLACPKPQLDFFFPHKGNRVTLPNYAWQLEHYGIKPSAECHPEKRRIHPLLGWSLDGVGNMVKVWENVLDPRMLPWLKHHVVGEAVVFPAAGYVEIALAAGKAFFDEASYTLEYLDIVAPLVFEENTAQVVRTTLEAGILKIMARPRLSEESEVPWMLYATGRLVEQKSKKLPLEVAASLGTDQEVLLRCQPENLYAQAQALGLEYGEYFQTLQDIHLHAHGLFAHIALNEDVWQDYILAPAALDTCFHALVAFIGKHKDIAPYGMAYLPVKTGNIMVLQEKLATDMSVQIVRMSTQSILANCSLYAADGTLVAYALQCRFRAAPLVHTSTSHVDTWQVKAYRKELTRAHAIAMPSIATLLEQWPVRACEHHGTQRAKWLTQTLPLLEMLSLAYSIESFSALQDENPKTLQVALQNPYGEWLMRLLSEQGLVSYHEEQWSFDTQEVPSSQELWQEIATSSPEALGALLPMGRIGLHLTKALSSEASLLALYNASYHAAVSKNLRSNDPTYTSIAQTSTKIVQNIVAQSDYPVRILEVGAFSYRLAQSLYSTLPTDRFSYTLACTEEDGVQHAQLLFESQENYNVFHLNQDWSIANNDSYDIVIVQQSLHLWQNISCALDYIKSALLPGGLFLATECHEHWHANFIHGLNPTWWRAQGQSALLSPAQWQALLNEKGFTCVSHKNEQYADDLQAGAYILLAQKPSLTENTDLQAPVATSHVLVLGDMGSTQAEPVLQALQNSLQAQGIISQNLLYNDCSEALSAVQSFIDSIAACNTDTLLPTVVFMPSNTVQIEDISKHLETLRSIACLMGTHNSLRLILICQGGSLCTFTPETQHNPATAALWGMGRTIMNEFPELTCTLLDIPQSVPLTLEAQALPEQSILGKLTQEILHPDGSDEVLLREESRHILMLDAATVKTTAHDEDEVRFKLGVTQPGKLTHLRWFEEGKRDLKAEQIEVQVMATGLNFRDVMLTLGLLPDDAVENGFAGPTLGLEFSGIVTRLGSNVTKLKVGDAVVGFAPSCFASHVITDADVVAPMPAHWHYEDAASVPTVFFTAYYALKHLANIQAGETLLIHGAAGGVGLAAIQVAKHLGVKIFATAGSDEKREFLRLQGIEHIFDSRSLNFATQIHNITCGQGVDVVLNSLAGEAMRRSVALLRPFGRFVELGKRDFVENTPIHLRPFKDNISYFAFDADQMLTAKPALSKQVFQDIMQLFAQDTFHMLPVRPFTADSTLEAFRAMQQAQHIGKIVISLRKPPKQRQSLRIDDTTQPCWQGHGTWLVTGGLEGFGLATAQWLTKHGVTDLVLVSRRGMNTPQAQNIIDDFKNNGVTVQIMACDVTSTGDVHELIHACKNMSPPVSGIVHSAALYQDAFLPELDQDSIAKVIAPKLLGAWNLHEASLAANLSLDYFVLFSSISTTLGNMGQANYVAANAGLESLAYLRHTLGLKATCIAWGPIGDVGYLTAHEKVKENLEKHMGTKVLSAEQAVHALPSFFISQQPVHIAANFHWQSLKRAIPHSATRFTRIFHATKSSGHGDGQSPQNMRALLASKSSAEAMDMLCEILTQEIAQVLSLDPQSMERNATLQSLGMDSLMAVELALGLEQRIGVRLPTMLLQDSPSIEKVAQRLLDKIFSKDVDTSESGDDLLNLANKHGENLNEEEIKSITKSSL